MASFERDYHPFNPAPRPITRDEGVRGAVTVLLVAVGLIIAALVIGAYI
jgi:hypothetical protein